jgi:hypothetical protein
MVDSQAFIMDDHVVKVNYKIEFESLITVKFTEEILIENINCENIREILVNGRTKRHYKVYNDKMERLNYIIDGNDILILLPYCEKGNNDKFITLFFESKILYNEYDQKKNNEKKNILNKQEVNKPNIFIPIYSKSINIEIFELKAYRFSEKIQLRKIEDNVLKNLENSISYELNPKYFSTIINESNPLEKDTEILVISLEHVFPRNIDIWVKFGLILGVLGFVSALLLSFIPNSTISEIVAIVAIAIATMTMIKGWIFPSEVEGNYQKYDTWYLFLIFLMFIFSIIYIIIFILSGNVDNPYDIINKIINYMLSL